MLHRVSAAPTRTVRVRSAELRCVAPPARSVMTTIATVTATTKAISQGLGPTRSLRRRAASPALRLTPSPVGRWPALVGAAYAVAASYIFDWTSWCAGTLLVDPINGV